MYSIQRAVILGCVLSAFGISWAVAGSVAQHLRCEYLENPQGIDASRPRLSWQVRASGENPRGLRQEAYQVFVASTPELLRTGKVDLWDSGKVKSGETLGIEYAGRALGSRARCYWQVRVWDHEGNESPWSEPAQWTMGLLEEQDWTAHWIADPSSAKRAVRLPRYGWLARPPRTATPPPDDSALPRHLKGTEHGYDSPVWVTVDLRRARTFDTIVFHPARELEREPQAAAHVFPLRFRIEAAMAPDFADAKTIVDRTATDEPDAADGQPRRLSFAAVTARHLRIRFTKLRPLQVDAFSAALAEIEVFGGSENLARGAVVRSSTTQKGGQWHPAFLTDGITEARPGNLRNFSPVLMRREFDLAKPVRRATAYVTARGLYELRLNGANAGDGRVLAPEWTDYRQRIHYQICDVTAMLKPGRNAVSAVVAPGWYSGQLGHAPLLHRFIYGTFPQLRAQIEVDFSDGTRDTIQSDASWHSTEDGPIRYADLIDGETVDARCERPGWDQPGFDHAAWARVAVDPPDAEEPRLTPTSTEDKTGPRERVRPHLVAQPAEPIRIVRELRPTALTQPRPGVHVFDLGENISGWCRLNVRAPAGTTVRLRHAEMLQTDGMVYVTNLRTAQAVDTYVARGDKGGETFEPQFTSHGFRYVEVTGLLESPRPEDLIGCFTRSSAPEVSHFECSDPTLNRVMEAMRRTIQGNMLSVPTDCPQRDERMGWCGDAQFAAPAGVRFMDMAGFYTKWCTDMRAGQFPDGRFLQIAPRATAESFGPSWSDAGVTVPWLLYVTYGDRRVLSTQFGAVRRWLAFVEGHNPDGVWRNQRGGDWGDWLNGDTLMLDGWTATGNSVPKTLWATAVWAHSTRLAERMAVALGEAATAAQLRSQREKITAAFAREFLAADGTLAGDTQAGYALALHYDLIPASQRTKVGERLQQAVRRRGGHPSTGIVATLPLFEALTATGQHDAAVRMILRRTPPSFGYMVAQGATTIWERWDGLIAGRGFGHPTMNSFNHPALAGVAAWVWAHVAGIQPDETQPGYRHFFAAPKPGPGLTWVRASYDSIRGRIEIAWEVADGKLSVRVGVPPNTTATLTLPNGRIERLSSGRHELDVPHEVSP
jgi:alpha-L-rhamnosidase